MQEYWRISSLSDAEVQYLDKQKIQDLVGGSINLLEVNMFAKINSLGLFGLNSFNVDVEIEISRGIPVFEIGGLPDLGKGKQGTCKSRHASLRSGVSRGKGDGELSPCRHEKKRAYVRYGYLHGCTESLRLPDTKH